MFGLVGFYHVSSPAGDFSVLSFCLACCVWGALSAGWKVVVPLNCSGLTVGGVGPVACQGFLGGGTCVCSGGWSWVSPLQSAVRCPVVVLGFLWVWYGFGTPIF